MKIFLYLALLSMAVIYALLKILEPTIFSVEELTPKNRIFVSSKVISICDDKNITVNDKFNKIRYIAVSNIKKVRIVIKNKERLIIIDNEASKFITDINDSGKSMWIVDKAYKHLYGYMGVEIKNENIDTFIVNKNGVFFAVISADSVVSTPPKEDLKEVAND